MTRNGPKKKQKQKTTFVVEKGRLGTLEFFLESRKMFGRIQESEKRIGKFLGFFEKNSKKFF